MVVGIGPFLLDEKKGHNKTMGMFTDFHENYFWIGWSTTNAIFFYFSKYHIIQDFTCWNLKLWNCDISLVTDRPGDRGAIHTDTLTAFCYYTINILRK